MGETDLNVLLTSMQPILREGEYVFCSIPPSQRSRLQVVPFGEFLEDEGLTMILKREDAEREGIAYGYSARMITLSVHSSLNAVGFLAAIATRLAAHNISVNAISAYYHDHLFVPSDRAEEALRILTQFK